jgi:hypothetical protein
MVECNLTVVIHENFLKRDNFPFHADILKAKSGDKNKGAEKRQYFKGELKLAKILFTKMDHLRRV